VYGQPSAPSYGQPSAPSYGQPSAPAYGVPPVYAAMPARQNTSALVLTIISALLTFSCYFTLAGLPSLILGIMALTKQNTDFEGSRRLSKIGWIVMAVVSALTILAIILFVVGVIASSSSSSTYDY